LKFGALSADAAAMLDAADGSALERYGERVISVASVDEVLRD
jgi:hypothetical protein